MKLLFCTHCHDIIRLFQEHRWCKCGKSYGYFIDDQTTFQTEYSFSLSIDDDDFMRAVEAFLQQSEHPSHQNVFHSWINATSEPDVQFIAEANTPNS